MNWEFGLAVVMLVVAGVFFVLALTYRTKIQVLKFTSYGLITLATLGLILLRFDSSGNLKIATLVFTVLAIIYQWFYRGALKDRDRN